MLFYSDCNFHCKSLQNINSVLYSVLQMRKVKSWELKWGEQDVSAVCCLAVQCVPGGQVPAQEFSFPKPHLSVPGG